MIPALPLMALARNKWVWMIAGGLAIAAICVWQLDEFGDRRYKAGELAERIVWQQVVQEAVEARNEANRRIDRLTADLNRQSAQLQSERREDLRETQEEIRNAATVEDQFAAYHAHRERVLNDAGSNLDRARADYLSSIGGQ